MKKYLIWLVLLIALVACKRDKEQPNPDPDLPPATQIGANTFGCYINGQPWTPKGNIGLGTNFYVSYDPNYLEGTLDIRVDRVIENNDVEGITIFSGKCKGVGTYYFEKESNQSLIFIQRKSNVFTTYNGKDLDTSMLGKLIITKFDLQAGIISGTFHFKLEKQGYPTIEATEGRFDKKL
jgi:hypothetical protein